MRTLKSQGAVRKAFEEAKRNQRIVLRVQAPDDLMLRIGLSLQALNMQEIPQKQVRGKKVSLFVLKNMGDYMGCEETVSAIRLQNWYSPTGKRGISFQYQVVEV